MKTVIAAKNQILASFSADEIRALANSLNEVLNNSSVDEHDCSARVGVGLAELKRLKAEISSVLDSRVSGSSEIFEAWPDSGSVQIRSISVFGDPADLSYDEVRDLIQPILDKEAKAEQGGGGNSAALRASP
jgi:hypothetical protein